MIPTKTHSFCPTCYRVIPATIHINGSVVITKTCPVHGSSLGVIDHDPVWWAYAMSLGNRDAYDGYMVDVTDVCNIHCKYCYHRSTTPTHRSVESIVADVRSIDTHIVILSGGEPTLHPQILDILDALNEYEVYVLTNGTMLCDRDRLTEFISHGLIHNDILSLGLSMHPESMGRDVEMLRVCRELGYRLLTVFHVIDDIKQLPYVLAFTEQYGDVIVETRVKAASNLWREQASSNPPVFVSDMVKVVERMGGEIDPTFNIMPYFAPMTWKGNSLRMVRWHDKYNIDLDHLIDSHPLYRAHDGTANCISVSCIINEGIECTK